MESGWAREEIRFIFRPPIAEGHPEAQLTQRITLLFIILSGAAREFGTMMACDKHVRPEPGSRLRDKATKITNDMEPLLTDRCAFPWLLPARAVGRRELPRDIRPLLQLPARNEQCLRSLEPRSVPVVFLIKKVD